MASNTVNPRRTLSLTDGAEFEVDHGYNHVLFIPEFTEGGIKVYGVQDFPVLGETEVLLYTVGFQGLNDTFTAGFDKIRFDLVAPLAAHEAMIGITRSVSNAEGMV